MCFLRNVHIVFYIVHLFHPLLAPFIIHDFIELGLVLS